MQLHNFKRHLAQMIGDVDDSIAAEEDAIISKVKKIVRDYRDVKSVRTTCIQLLPAGVFSWNKVVLLFFFKSSMISSFLIC